MRRWRNLRKAESTLLNWLCGGSGCRPWGAARRPVKPDDHSEVVPLLPIPNRTVKRLSADDSADARVKVGHRQANIPPQPPPPTGAGGLVFW